jgi:hypothetical protein
MKWIPGAIRVWEEEEERRERRKRRKRRKRRWGRWGGKERYCRGRQAHGKMWKYGQLMQTQGRAVSIFGDR